MRRKIGAGAMTPADRERLGDALALARHFVFEVDRICCRYFGIHAGPPKNAHVADHKLAAVRDELGREIQRLVGGAAADDFQRRCWDGFGRALRSYLGRELGRPVKADLGKD